MEIQQNQNKSPETLSGMQVTNSLSGGNTGAHFTYVYKKTEKLVTALYMITNFIKDNEPLKWKFRDNALKLLSLNRAFTTVSLSDRKDCIKEYQGIAGEIVSLASIASHSGLISEMNGAVLSREFNSLISHMEKDENRKLNEETVLLDPGFFNVAHTAVAAPRPSHTHSENVLYTPSQKTHDTSHGNPVFDKGHIPEKTEVKTETAINTKPEYLSLKEVKERTVKPAESKDSRQAVILKILSKKGGLNVKDFEDSIKGVSTKTIQRELLSMVASGVLKKEGERRWSTYSLAS